MQNPDLLADTLIEIFTYEHDIHYAEIVNIKRICLNILMYINILIIES